jgi:hypothetical protein
MRPGRRLQTPRRCYVSVTEFRHLGTKSRFQLQIPVVCAPKLLLGRPSLDLGTLGEKSESSTETDFPRAKRRKLNRPVLETSPRGVCGT